MVTNDKLKSLTSFPSQELVSSHVHKLVRVYSFPFHNIFLYTYIYVCVCVCVCVCMSTYIYIYIYILQLSSHSSQVLGESLRLTTDYLNIVEKAVVANSKLEFVEVKSSKLRKDLIVAMDETSKANEKIKELSEALRVEKMLVIQKDEEIQATFLKTNVEKEKVVQQFMQFDQFFDL